MAKSKGRPKDAPNKNYDIVDKVLTRCAACGSTNRGEYVKRDEVDAGGVHVDPVTKVEFNTVVYQTCECLDCHQWRRDRSVELKD